MSEVDWSEDEMINFIKEGGANRKKSLAKIYQNTVLRDRVYNFVKYKGGTVEEASDLHLESILVFDRNIRDDKFNQKSNINTYVYAIAKFTWMNYIRKKKKQASLISDTETYLEPMDHKHPELIFIEDELKTKLESIIGLLSEKCKIILKMWSDNAKYDEIAARLGVEKTGSLRKQKMVCLRKLREHLTAHPELIPSYYHE